LKTDLRTIAHTRVSIWLSYSPQVSGHLGPEQLDGALQGADLVVIPAGVPRKPGAHTRTHAHTHTHAHAHTHTHTHTRIHMHTHTQQWSCQFFIDGRYVSE